MNLEGTRLGKYELQTEIGRGGMGIVYRGYDPTLARPVAVKVLAPNLVGDENFVRRFLREAQAAAGLKHPSVVTIHDVGQQSGWYYFVMEYLEGQPLSHVLRERGPLPADEALSILSQLADALDYAHTQGLVHRDVKPANVMVDQRGHITLMDFGLVRAAQGMRLTATGTTIGTPQYMSPEQVAGESVGPAADLYSLAIVAYELLAGAPPFDADSTPAILYMQVHEPPPLITTRCSDLPPAVNGVLRQALAKDPAIRYQSGAAFVMALTQALSSPPPSECATQPDEASTVVVAWEPLTSTPSVSPAPAPPAEEPPVAGVRDATPNSIDRRSPDMHEPPEFERGPRDFRRPPEAEIEMPPPTQASQAPSTSLTSLLLPAGFTIVGLIVMSAVGSSMGSMAMIVSMAISLPMMLGSYLVSFINYRSQKRAYQHKVKERESKYRAMLDRQRQDLEHLRDQTQAALVHNDPAPADCLGLVERLEPCRLWAREPYDDDFLTLRLGLGRRPFQVVVKPPRQPSPLEPDPLIQAAEEVAAEFAEVPQAPVTLPLRQVGIAGLSGPRPAVLNAARALALQIAAHHAPRDVKIVAIYPASEAEEWEWLRWLPHTWSDDRNHRFLAHGDAAHNLLTDFYEMLSKRRVQMEQDKDVALRQPGPDFIFFLAAPRVVENEPIYALLLKQGPALGAFPVFFAEREAGLPRQCHARATLETGQPTLRVPGATLWPYDSDAVSVEMADRFSRTMAPIRLKHHAKAEEIPATVPLLEALGVERVEDLAVLSRWKTNDPYDSMAVPIGRRAGGELQYLDLHEPRSTKEPTIRYGHGPNALVAGTVGSGKSELLQSLVASLTVHYHPHEVIFVLLDFKPPGMAEALRNLPHVVNVIDLNELDLVPRALQSLEEELKRRGRLFKAVGVDHIDDYVERHRKHDPRAREPLPYLVLIVDEFTVLKQKLPETMNRFEQVAIRGRAFGFRMILAAQKPAGVVSQQVDANTALRLCLRVARPEDSQELIKRDDAARLTGAGRVYMRIGEDAVFELFQSAWSGAPYAPGGYVVSDPHEIVEIALDGSRHPLCLSPRPTVIQEADTQLKAVVAHIQEEAQREGIQRLPGPWLELLPVRLALEEVRPARGWDGKAWQLVDRWLCPAIGLQDDPDNQRQPLLEPDLGHKGHLFICSGPGFDNRQVLRTLVTSLATDHSPAELHLYCLDLGSLGFQVFAGLPHTGAVIRKEESRRIGRLFRWLLEELASRKRWCAQRGVGSLAEAHAQRTSAGDALPALVLVVDNLSALGEDLDAIDLLAQLAREGQAAGIHLILAGDQTAARFSKVLDNVALRIAFQLEEVADYRMLLGEYPQDLFLPRGVHGRGLFSGPPALECQVASPASGEPGGDAETELATLVAEMKQAWAASGGRPPVSIGVLPSRALLRDLLSGWTAYRAPCPPAVPLCVPLGLDDLTLKPIGVDLAADGPHFMIAGPPQGGKTTALISWVLALAECFPQEMVQFFLLDTFKGSLAALRDLPHVRGYGAMEQEHVDVLAELDAVLETRRRGKQVGARPALVIVADDAEFLTSDNVKDKLRECARRDHPFGFHVILAGAAAEMGQYDAFRTQVRSNRSGLLVGSNDLIQDTGIFNLTLPRDQLSQALPPGRAYLVRRGQARLIQVATPGDLAAVREWVAQIAARKQSGAQSAVGGPV